MRSVIGNWQIYFHQKRKKAFVIVLCNYTTMRESHTEKLPSVQGLGDCIEVTTRVFLTKGTWNHKDSSPGKHDALCLLSLK
jgi:hypothetical protein